MTKPFVFPAYEAGFLGSTTKTLNTYKPAPKHTLVRRQEVHMRPRAAVVQNAASASFMGQIAHRGLCIDLKPPAPNVLRRQPTSRVAERPVALARHRSAPVPPPPVLYNAAPMARTVSAPGPTPVLRRRNEVRVREPEPRRVLAARRV